MLLESSIKKKNDVKKPQNHVLFLQHTQCSLAVHLTYCIREGSAPLLHECHSTEQFEPGPWFFLLDQSCQFFQSFAAAYQSNRASFQTRSDPQAARY